MEDTAFSDDFCRFLQTSIPAVDAAELLLLIADRPDVWWTMDEALGKLGKGSNLAPADAARHVDGFQAAGLVERGADRRFRFHPSGEGLAAHVRTLAQAYEERPVTLIRVIYALRDTKISTFADAFRLRKK